MQVILVCMHIHQEQEDEGSTGGQIQHSKGKRKTEGIRSWEEKEQAKDKAVEAIPPDKAPIPPLQFYTAALLPAISVHLAS